MKNLSFLIKPASGHCNMRCRYCFYEDETSLREAGNSGMMTPGTADTLIEEAFAALESGGMVTFAFQGGEPTLAGLPYFRHFTAKVREANQKNVSVHYAIQTNGLALDKDWAQFFRENNFLVGISLDGDKAIHDFLRPDAGGKETWSRVSKNLSLLKGEKVDCNLLCVVSRQCAKHPQKVYRSLQKLGGYLQFIPCLDPLEAQRGSMPYSLTPELYGDFLCALFDEWYRDFAAGNYTSIRLFDDYIHLAMGLPAGTCSTAGTCGAYLVVEGDGTLYPCDFYCLDQWKLGKLGELSLTDAMEGDTARRFLREGLDHPAECASCPYARLCNGGCKRDWVRGKEGNHNYFCPAFRKFFDYAGDRIARIARAQQGYGGL